MKIISISGKKINDREIKKLYQLRLSILPLKPSVNQSEDYSYFHNYARTSQQIFIFKSKKKEIKGFYFCRYKKLKLNSKTFIQLEPEYGIIAKPYRGQANNFLPMVYVILYLTIRYPFYPLYFAVTTYPGSYSSLKRQMPVVLDSIEFLNATEKAILENYGKGINATLKNTSYVCENPTIPECNAEILARYEKKECYARYKKLNPDWSVGKSLVVICPVHKYKMAKRVFKAMLKGKRSG